MAAVHLTGLSGACSVRAVVLNAGAVVYDGASEHLLNDPALLAQYGLM